MFNCISIRVYINKQVDVFALDVLCYLLLFLKFDPYYIPLFRSSHFHFLLFC